MTYAFQTPEKLCFILDLMNGGDLHYHLSQHGVFSEKEVRFYAAEVILGLEHMHKRFVVYRDLKVILITNQLVDCYWWNKTISPSFMVWFGHIYFTSRCHENKNREQEVKQPLFTSKQTYNNVWSAIAILFGHFDCSKTGEIRDDRSTRMRQYSHGSCSIQ